MNVVNGSVATAETTNSVRSRLCLETTQWHFYLSPAATWEAMYQDCTNATQSIVLEQYIFENDDVGRKFMRLFIDKAKEGLKICLLCDEIGSRSFCKSPLLKELRSNGGTFRFYNSFKLIDIIKPRHIFPRTHVKTLIIDKAIAYVGGVCIDQRMANWRDTQIRIMGPIVEEIERISYCNITETKLPNLPKYFLNFNFFFLQSEPGFFDHPIYAALLDALGHARKSVYISTAFFVPSRRLRHSLKKAAFKGAKVIVLIPFHSDSQIADLACLSYAGKLLKAGVRIFRYQPSVLHSKTALIDGTWGTVGSSNMDALSFFHNRESNLFIKDKEALAEMEEDFLNDLKHSKELTLDFLKATPLWKRFAMHAARVCRSFL